MKYLALIVAVLIICAYWRESRSQNDTTERKNPPEQTKYRNESPSELQKRTEASRTTKLDRGAGNESGEKAAAQKSETQTWRVRNPASSELNKTLTKERDDFLLFKLKLTQEEYDRVILQIATLESKVDKLQSKNPVEINRLIRERDVAIENIMGQDRMEWYREFRSSQIKRIETEIMSLKESF